MGVYCGEHQCIPAGLQCLGDGIWPIRGRKILHHGHIWTGRARREAFDGYVQAKGFGAKLIITGIVPRAAAVLFDRLRASGHTRQTSGIRQPNRFSMGNIPSYSAIKAQIEDKNWQMKATYVEVTAADLPCSNLADDHRSTTNTSATCSSQNLSPPTSGRP
jgi:hypothetical protein